MVWQRDGEGRTLLSRQCRDRLGITRASPGDDPWAGVLHPADAARLRAAERQAIAARKPFSHEARFRHADGRYRWLRDTGRPLGRTGFVGVLEDVTARKNAERSLRNLKASFEAQVAEGTEALRQSERNFRGLFEGSATAIAVINLRTGEQQCNPALRAMLGYTEDELRRLEPMSLVHPEDREENRALLARLARGEVSSFAIENRYLRKDGSPLWVDKHVSALAGADGRPERFVVFVHDATARHGLFASLHARLESATRAHLAGQTVAAIAHELNQPLVAIGLYCETALQLLEQGAPDAPRLRSAIAGAAEQAKRAGVAMRELMDVAARGATPTEPLDLGALAKQVALKVREKHANAFDIVLDVPPQLPRVLGHPHQLGKALLILMENGAEAMSAGHSHSPTITISVAALAGEDMVRATVRDNGPGIDAVAHARLFEPFFTTKPHGLGMGLPVCRSMIEAQGGQLWADAAPGPGAAFHFTLPVAPSPARSCTSSTLSADPHLDTESTGGPPLAMRCAPR